MLSRSALGVAVVTSGALLLSGCSSDDSTKVAADSNPTTAASSGDQACVSAAYDFLKKDWDQPRTTLPAGYTPLKSKPKAGGKVVTLVVGAAPTDGQGQAAIAEAAKSIGWTAQKIVYNGTPEDLNAKFQQAVSAKPTVITVAGQPASALKGPLAAAKAAGIVVSLSGQTTPPSDYPGYSASALPGSTAQLEADVAANWVARDSGCKANVTVINVAGLTYNKAEADGFVASLGKLCTGCKTSVHNIQLSDLGSPAATNAVVSALQADPSSKYLMFTLGNAADGASAALRQAGLNGVKILGMIPDAASIAGLKDGSHSMWVNLPININGWAQLDAALRALDAAGPVEVTDFPFSMLTKQTVPEDAKDGVDYPTDYKQLFQALWLVG